MLEIKDMPRVERNALLVHVSPLQRVLQAMLTARLQVCVNTVAA